MNANAIDFVCVVANVAILLWSLAQGYRSGHPIWMLPLLISATGTGASIYNMVSP